MTWHKLFFASGAVFLLLACAITKQWISWASARPLYHRSLEVNDKEDPHIIKINDTENIGISQFNTKRNPRIRHAVIHVGPPKTATTTIQFAMQKDFGHFARDGYYSKGPFHEMASCLNFNEHYKERCNRRINDKVKAALDDAVTNYDHLFVSSECFGTNKHLITNLAYSLEPYNTVTIVLTYRRFFEWLASKYNQFFRTLKEPLNQKGVYPGLVQYLNPQRLKYFYNERYIPGFYREYSQRFQNVRLFNLHNATSIDADFYCSMIPGARTACRAARNRGQRGKILADKNHAVNLDYDRIVREAHTMNLFPNTINIDRAIRATKNRQEMVLGLRIDDFPKQCMSKEQLDLVLSMSLEVEKKHFPEWFDSPQGKADLRARFLVAAKSTLCNVDVKKVLLDPNWRNFFIEFGKRQQ